MTNENNASIRIGGSAKNVKAKSGSIDTKGHQGSSNDVSIHIGQDAIKSELQVGSIREVSESTELSELHKIVQNFLENLVNEHPVETKPIVNDASVRIGRDAIDSKVGSGLIQIQSNQKYVNDVSISVEGNATGSEFDGGTISESANRNLAESKAFVVEAIQQEIRQNPTLKTRLINAFKAGGVEALKAIFNNPLISIPIETVKGFIEAE